MLKANIDTASEKDSRPELRTSGLWSSRDVILCAQHATEIDRDRWVAEGWKPLPIERQWFRGVRYQCARCAGDGRPVRRGPQLDERRAGPNDRRRKTRSDRRAPR
jgi:hypothetical protein